MQPDGGGLKPGGSGNVPQATGGGETEGFTLLFFRKLQIQVDTNQRKTNVATTAVVEGHALKSFM